MGVLEPILAIVGWLVTAGIAGVTGSFVLQGRNNERVEKVRSDAEQSVEKLISSNKENIQSLIAENKEHIEGLISESRTRSDVVLRHLQNVETMVNNMRAELPEKYTLKSDFLRLEDKVESFIIKFYRHSGLEPDLKD